MVFADQDSRECKRIKQKASKTYPAYAYKSPKSQCPLPLLCYWFSLNSWSRSTVDCGWVHRVWLPRPPTVQSAPKQSPLWALCPLQEHQQHIWLKQEHTNLWKTKGLNKYDKTNQRQKSLIKQSRRVSMIDSDFKRRLKILPLHPQFLNILYSFWFFLLVFPLGNFYWHILQITDCFFNYV